jgi:hypothetical protein
MLPENICFYGNDIAMPIFEVEGSDTIRFNPDYYDPATNSYHPVSTVNGVKYLDANRPEYNILSSRFLADDPERFDFVSMCRTLHHLGHGQKYEQLPFSSKRLVSPDGKDFTDRSVLLSTRSQQTAVDRMLSILEIGGLLFVEPSPYLPFYITNNRILLESEDTNLDLMFAVQRASADEYVLYDDSPIPFVANEKWPWQSDNMKMIDGRPGGLPFYFHTGAIKAFGITDKTRTEAIRELFYRSDALAIRHVSWKNSIWKGTTAALKILRAISMGSNASLPDLFRAYLKNVPEDCMDTDLKNGIIEEAVEIQDSN